MINDLALHGALIRKHVDERAVSEVNKTSNVQEIVDCLEDSSRANKFQLNCDKCKDLLPRGGKWHFQESIYVVWFRAIIEVLYKMEYNGNEFNQNNLENNRVVIELDASI